MEHFTQSSRVKIGNSATGAIKFQGSIANAVRRMSSSRFRRY